MDQFDGQETINGKGTRIKIINNFKFKYQKNLITSIKMRWNFTTKIRKVCLKVDENYRMIFN